MPVKIWLRYIFPSWQFSYLIIRITNFLPPLKCLVYNDQLIDLWFLIFFSDHHGKCDIVNSRVFSSRRQFRRFKHRQNRRQNRQRNRSKRVKRDRSLLAVSQKGPKYWPRWCNKVAFFRVFKQDFTLCLYSHRFKEDPILAYSNPNIGTTIYGYKEKKYYQELGKWLLVCVKQILHCLIFPWIFKGM